MNKKKLWMICGIIGAILLGAGDWLLGYVDPTPVEGMSWDWLVQGYVTGYNTSRSAITMSISTLGILFYLPCMWQMGSVFTDDKLRRKTGWLMVAGLFGWLVIHYFYSITTFLFAWMATNTNAVLAGEVTIALKDAMFIGVASWYPVMLAPFIVHFWGIFRGKSCLPKKMLLFHPLVWMLLLHEISAILPSSPFSNGLYTFSLNGGMLVWLIAMLCRTGKYEATV